MHVFSKHLFGLGSMDLSTVASLFETTEGRFAETNSMDLYRAVSCYSVSDQVQVAVKVIRATLESRPQLNESINSTLVETAKDVSRASHDNICPILSISSTTEGATAIIQPFYAGGNIRNFLTLHPGSNRLSLLRQAASGLAHAHSLDIVHGNIKPENLLVGDQGKILVADFQVNVCLRQEEGHRTGRFRVPLSWAYKPDEELPTKLSDEVGVPFSKAGDVFAFACVIYEVLAGRPLFYPGKLVRRLMLLALGSDVRRGERPDAIPPRVWMLLRRCWAVDTNLRPSMDIIECELRSLVSMF